MDTEPLGRGQESCLDRSVSALTVNDVYEIAKLVGAELERTIDGHGRESVEGLVPKIVKVLELLESFASGNHAHKLREEELIRTFESFQLRRRGGRDGDENPEPQHGLQDLQQAAQQWKDRCEDLQCQIQQLQEDREELQSRLKGSHAQEDRMQRQEREVMLKLKEVVDKQRDELRAKVQQITTISKEVEALQEQLERFMKMNGDLRHKHNVLQAQLKSSVERKADMEADLKEKNKEIENLQALLDRTNSNAVSYQAPSESQRISEDDKDPDLPCFSKKEVRDILFERNELKTNLFLVQEELNYYQREILNEERCPGFLLEAVRSAIKQKRRLIKAKMLGIPVNECSSSDDEERQTEVDGAEVDGSEKPAESRIRNLFGFLTRSGSSRSPSHMSSSASTWEIIDDSEASEEVAQRTTP